MRKTPFKIGKTFENTQINVYFSQGGLAVVELLKHIDDETYNQLAAAYVLGYKVTKADMAQCSHIRPAEVETDTGVTITR